MLLCNCAAVSPALYKRVLSPAWAAAV
uniref:Uncharacterized protein n=1 Tax=Arundo donax TaxID=35708 RepID=A0A0A8YU00_ARUDO